MNLPLYTILIVLFHLSCQSDKTTKQQDVSINCTENGCSSSYTGPEFIDGSDVAHKFSNKMSKAVGDKLKELYKSKNYKKVNFEAIQMSTKGMGTGNVVYTLQIPFVSVASKCNAYTSFDHVGGWNHTPALEGRKEELKNVTLLNHQLNISTLKTTPEGLQEYWIQWKNKPLQKECE
ncbi:hypothetical protein M0G43_07575 [Subsaxibacter sp. CAU 1640]|uniref:hypothetical protein n=1 Tax=Subsaxibacter sp. CAU 1640 TaxID=2933271 RepID=UPI00200359F1|nr:hypothetical protein [Subsaxibacter sp. CAU 1640]MCK7590427.1 hypothetical protein [Subsaxibacter sp. CAU 1640]